MNKVIGDKLGKDDKDKKVSLKCLAFIRQIVHERFVCVGFLLLHSVHVISVGLKVGAGKTNVDSAV